MRRETGNHSGYRQVRGRKTTAEEILDLYAGLEQSYLADFDMMLSGYIPSAEAVEAVGKIGRELRLKSTTRPGSFFWVLDPVMGDDGRLYISEEVVPVYKSLLREADLVLPNQLEAETLSGVKIIDLESLGAAIRSLHSVYRVQHVVITSVRLDPQTGSTTHNGSPEIMACIGSSATSDWQPRLWKIDIPTIPAFFSGTGDMFAALTVARFRAQANSAGIASSRGWRCADDIMPTELPLAKAVELVLAGMQTVLNKTYDKMQEQLKSLPEQMEGLGQGDEDREEMEKKKRLLRTKAAEVRVVRHVGDLKNIPEEARQKFKAVQLTLDLPPQEDKKPDEHGVVHLGGDGEGAVHVEHKG